MVFEKKPIHGSRRTSFELDIFTNLTKIDIYPTEISFIEVSGEKYTVRKNLEDLYYVARFSNQQKVWNKTKPHQLTSKWYENLAKVLTEDGGKVVDNFLRVLFTWRTENEVTDVKDSLNFTLARIIRHSGSAYRWAAVAYI